MGYREGGGLRGDSQTLGFQTLGLQGSESTFNEIYFYREIPGTAPRSTSNEIYF